MDISLSATCIVGIQLLLLPIQAWTFLIRSADKTRFRFLLLILGFLSFNVLCLFQSDYLVSINKSIILSNYLGYFLCGYLYYYIAKESGFNRYQGVWVLIIGLSLLEIITSLIELNTYALAMLFFTVLSLTVLKLIKYLFEKTTSSILFVQCSKSVLTLSIVSPFFICNFEGMTSKMIICNLSFFIMSFGYYKHFLTLNKKENDHIYLARKSAFNLLEQNQSIERSAIRTYGLNGALLEIAEMLVEGYSQNEIAVKRHVTPASIRNQCCKIYKKVDVKGLKEFKTKFNHTPRI